MTTDLRRQAQAILAAIQQARAELRGPGPASKRVGRATLFFSAYTKDGVLAPHVRDVYNAQGVGAMEAGLGTLESLARAVLEPDEEQKLRKDVNEIAHRVMREATGQCEKTPHPGERTDDQKDPEAVKRGARRGQDTP